MDNIDFYIEVGYLKSLPRKGWADRNIPNPETVAEHMYRSGFIAYDIGKKMGVDPILCSHIMHIHDLPEARAGDITPHDGISKEDKAKLELKAAKELVLLSGNNEYLELFLEYEEKSTLRSQIGNDADKLECVLQALEYGILYPHMRPLLEDFWPYAQTRLKTDVGIEMFMALKKRKETLGHSSLPRLKL